MAYAEKNPRKPILPGIRGVLIVILCYLVIQVFASAFLCWTALFGFGNEAGYLNIFTDAELRDLVFQLETPVLVVLAFEVLVPFLFLGIWIVVLVLYVNRKRVCERWFLCAIAAGPMFMMVKFALVYALGGETAPAVMIRGGVAVALAAWQAFITSPRTKAVFVR